MHSHLNRAIALFSVAFLLVGAGCGSGEATPSPATPTAAPATATPRAALPTARPTAMPTLAPTLMPTQAPALRVGLDAANPPWCYTDSQGILRASTLTALTAGARDGRAPGGRVPGAAPAGAGLAARRVDLAAAGLVSTTERAKSMVLSSPYLMLEQAVVVRSADPASGPAALAGRSVGVQIGSVAAAEARGAGGTVRAYDDLAIALAALARGEVQAVLGERPAAVDYIRRHPEWAWAGTAGVGQPVALGVARDNAALLQRVNAALDALSRRGELAGLEQRWLQ